MASAWVAGGHGGTAYGVCRSVRFRECQIWKTVARARNLGQQRTTCAILAFGALMSVLSVADGGWQVAV